MKPAVTSEPPTKLCLNCDTEKSIGSFSRNKHTPTGRQDHCKVCMANRQRAYRCTPAGHAALHRDYLKDRSRRLVRNFGLTLADYERLSEAQGGACAVCQAVPAQLVVDHCHTENRVRGLLCPQCNTGLGMMKDSPASVAGLLVYLHASGKALTTEEMNDFLAAMETPIDI